MFSGKIEACNHDLNFKEAKERKGRKIKAYLGFDELYSPNFLIGMVKGSHKLEGKRREKEEEMEEVLKGKGHGGEAMSLYRRA